MTHVLKDDMKHYASCSEYCAVIHCQRCMERPASHGAYECSKCATTHGSYRRYYWVRRNNAVVSPLTDKEA